MAPTHMAVKDFERRLKQGMNIMSFMPGASFTSLSLKPTTLRQLRAYKVGGMTYDDVLQQLMEETPPAKFIEWHLQQVRDEPRVAWDDVKKRLKL